MYKLEGWFLLVFILLYIPTWNEDNKQKNTFEYVILSDIEEITKNKNWKKGKLQVIVWFSSTESYW